MATLDTLFNNVKLTENGDLAYKSTLNPMLDLLFMSEYYQNHLNEVKIGQTPIEQVFAMFMRDPRNGLGRRDLGRVLMQKSGLALETMPMAGRYDDVFFNWKDMSQEEFNRMAAFLFEECNKGNELAKKWMPRYSSKNLMLARKLAATYGMNKQTYGKFIKANTTEAKLSQHNENAIKFESVPSQALMKYYAAFKKNSLLCDRFNKFIEEVKKGTKNINVATSTVYDIYRNCDKIDPDVFFDKIEKVSGSWIPVVDTSGSMVDPTDSFGKALAIGHYLAKCSTYAPNQVISFSSRPQLITLGEPVSRRYCYDAPKGDSQWHKEINSMYTGDCSNTDFGAVMRVLQGIDSNNAPDYIVVLSDMEFDMGSNQSLEETMRMFKAAGIHTRIVWWNFNSRSTTSPETIKCDKSGNVFLSGYNPTLLKYLKVGFDGETFLRVLLTEYINKVFPKNLS